MIDYDHSFLLEMCMYFKNNYYFLSNMHPCEIKIDIDGTQYAFSCVESAYQAHKCPSRSSEFIGLNGYEAKRLGKKVELRNDWDDIKSALMKELVKQKFSNLDLLGKLKEIEGEIVETNNWGDTFWGKCYGKGQNVLGKILMEIRDGKI